MDSRFNLPKLPQVPLPDVTKFKDQNLADEFYRRLYDYIVKFENGLGENEEVALKLVSFGETVTIIVEDLGYWNPSLITFHGKTLKGERVKLIQHVSQISFLLIAVKTERPVQPQERIGFKLAEAAGGHRETE